jgi:hypothetical protein
MHWFGSEKGESEGFCEKSNEISGMREMSSLAEQLLFIEGVLLSMWLGGWLVNYEKYTCHNVLIETHTKLLMYKLILRTLISGTAFFISTNPFVRKTLTGNG